MALQAKYGLQVKNWTESFGDTTFGAKWLTMWTPRPGARSCSRLERKTPGRRSRFEGLCIGAAIDTAFIAGIFRVLRTSYCRESEKLYSFMAAIGTVTDAPKAGSRRRGSDIGRRRLRPIRLATQRTYVRCEGLGGPLQWFGSANCAILSL